MATTNTWKTIAERIARAVFAGQHPIKQTASSGAVGSWVCASDSYPYTSPSAYRGVNIWVIYDAGGAAAAPENQERAVTAAGFTIASGTLAVQPNFTAAPASGDIALFLYGLHRDDLLEATNDVIRNLTLPRYSVVSLCNDANMENAAADCATDWPDVAGTPTQTKETSIVMTGTQSLKVVYTVLDDSVRSLSIPVTENEQLNLSVPVKCTAGSLNVQLYDVTNAAEILSATVDEEAWTRVQFPAAVPSGCQNVQVRFIAKTAATTAYVDHVALTSQARSLYDLAAPLVEGADIDGLFYWPVWQSSEASYSYMEMGAVLQPYSRGNILRDYAGVTSHRIEIPRSKDDSIWVKYRTPGTALAALTDTCYAPIELLVAGAASECLKRLAARAADDSAKNEYLRRAFVLNREHTRLLRYYQLGFRVEQLAQERVRV